MYLDLSTAIIATLFAMSIPVAYLMGIEVGRDRERKHAKEWE